MKLFFLGLVLSGLALATQNDLSHRPKSFTVPHGKAVFVDFIDANYNIVYDIPARSAEIVATIIFTAPESGFPIFDSVATPTAITLNNKATTAEFLSTPSNETKVRVLNEMVSVGRHTMVVTVPLTSLVEFKDGGVKSAFWTSDLSERQYLERYMPANFEFDQVKMSFDISFKGNKTKQKVYSNGVVSQKASGSVRISYPNYYTSSSIFFHTVPEGATDELRFSVKSLDGRELPAVVYASKSLFTGSASLERLKNKTIEIFHELESDYGAFPHPSIIVYNAGAGGMEYCGATMTDSGSLGHELFHSYFARAVMPANGNAGWLDEALASWRDKGYQSSTTLMGSSRMSSHPYYTRTTDTAAYSFGARFMAYMDGKLQSKGGLKPFMRYMIDKRKFSPLFVDDFIKEMNAFYGVSVDGDFKKYTFGSSDNFTFNKSDESHIHRKMTLEELQKHL